MKKSFKKFLIYGCVFSSVWMWGCGHQGVKVPEPLQNELMSKFPPFENIDESKLFPLLDSAKYYELDNGLKIVLV